MRVNAITMRDHFGGGVSFGGGTRGCGFYVSVLPQLFTHTIVWVYWLPFSPFHMTKRVTRICEFPNIRRRKALETNDTSFE
jgi:hypothetical protein